MAQRVIDALEMVKVDEHQRHALAHPPCPFEGHAKCRFETAAVIQSGQWVSHCLPPQLFFQRLALRDVLEDDDQPVGLAGQR